MEVLDTNVIVRFLVGDHAKHQAQAVQWLEQAEQNKREILIKPLVVAETCFVLESFYKKSRTEIAEAMLVFLSQKWLHVENRDELLSLWPWYRKKFHFVDSYLLAWAKVNNGQVLSFDKKLMKAS